MNRQNKATKFIIFYSWQSDLPESINKKFIAKALEKSVSILNKKAKELGIGKKIVEIDRDTKNTTGMPDIGNTILEKIKKCNVLVSDVSLVGSITPPKDTESKIGRLTPNPNVLIELGYAAGLPHISYDRIISLMNTHFGEPENLPFDIKVKRVTKYSISPEDNEEKIREEQEKLAKNLAEYISPFLEKDQGSLLVLNEPVTSIEFGPSLEDCDEEGRLIIPTFDYEKIYEKIAERVKLVEREFIIPEDDISLLSKNPSEFTDRAIKHNDTAKEFIKIITENPEIFVLCYSSITFYPVFELSNTGGTTVGDLSINVYDENSKAIFYKDKALNEIRTRFRLEKIPPEIIKYVKYLRGENLLPPMTIPTGLTMPEKLLMLETFRGLIPTDKVIDIVRDGGLSLNYKGKVHPSENISFVLEEEKIQLLQKGVLRNNEKLKLTYEITGEGITRIIKGHIEAVIEYKTDIPYEDLTF